MHSVSKIRTIVPTFRGIPFKWKGTDPGTGMDCYTFANYIRVVLLEAPLVLDVPAGLYPEGGVVPVPRGFLLKTAYQYGYPVASPEPYNILIINLANEDCLATLLPTGDLAFMTYGGSKLRSLKKFSGGSIRGIFEPSQLTKKLLNR